MPTVLRSGISRSERVEIHDEHFPPSAKDTEWLREVGARGWVVLSQDQAITRNPLEQQAIISSNVAFFGVGSADVPANVLGAVLVQALPGIRRALRRCPVPMIATVTLKAEVSVKWEAGQRLVKPRRIKSGR